jgi:hypothetical protein
MGQTLSWARTRLAIGKSAAEQTARACLRWIGMGFPNKKMQLSPIYRRGLQLAFQAVEIFIINGNVARCQRHVT